MGASAGKALSHVLQDFDLELEEFNKVLVDTKTIIAGSAVLSAKLTELGLPSFKPDDIDLFISEDKDGENLLTLERYLLSRGYVKVKSVFQDEHYLGNGIRYKDGRKFCVYEFHKLVVKEEDIVMKEEDIAHIAQVGLTSGSTECAESFGLRTELIEIIKRTKKIQIVNFTDNPLTFFDNIDLTCTKYYWNSEKQVIEYSGEEPKTPEEVMRTEIVSKNANGKLLIRCTKYIDRGFKIFHKGSEITELIKYMDHTFRLDGYDLIIYLRKKDNEDL